MGSSRQAVERRTGSSRGDALSLDSGTNPMRALFEGSTATTDRANDPGASQSEVSQLLSALDPADTNYSTPELADALEDSASALRWLRASAPGQARLLGLVEAADFAGRVEELSRSLEYLQVVAAQAVERTRNEARGAQSSAAPGWSTGWTETSPGTQEHAVPSQAGEASDAHAVIRTSDAALLDDGYRNAAQFLRARLRIS
ncbi:HNH endonuclease, partial [Paenarthrobacter sp. UW852]|nr:HNH endonuclease [Paenarthrobacter sp. UW852]